MGLDWNKQSEHRSNQRNCLQVHNEKHFIISASKKIYSIYSLLSNTNYQMLIAALLHKVSLDTSLLHKTNTREM